MPRKKSGDFDNKVYQNEYHKSMKNKLISFNPSSPEDMELWWFLMAKGKGNVTPYIKELIRKYMKESKKMKYRINPEYADLWGEDADAVLTADDIEMIARGWEKPVEVILPQLIPENFRAAVELMDDEIREAVHADLAPCTDAAFLWEYCKRHEAKYGKPFVI